MVMDTLRKAINGLHWSADQMDGAARMYQQAAIAFQHAAKCTESAADMRRDSVALMDTLAELGQMEEESNRSLGGLFGEGRGRF